MKVSELLNHGFTALSLTDGGREIVGTYAGDLLSWVMGRCEADQAWVTIMSNRNVIAVAALKDPSVVILSEGVVLDEELKALAIEKEINVLSTERDTAAVCVLLSELSK